MSTPRRNKFGPVTPPTLERANFRISHLAKRIKECEATIAFYKSSLSPERELLAIKKDIAHHYERVLSKQQSNAEVGGDEVNDDPLPRAFKESFRHSEWVVDSYHMFVGAEQVSLWGTSKACA